MSIINFEIVDIDTWENIASVESDFGFMTELSLDELPPNLKVGQTLMCNISLSAVSKDRDSQEHSYSKDTKPEFGNFGRRLRY